MAASPQGGVNQAEGLRVLVVEDNAGDRWFFSEILRARGHTVVSCETGEAAWEAFQANPTELVMLDVMLPGMDGPELCSRIREHPGGQACVVLAATGRDDPEALQGMLDAGADDYVRKPVDPDLLGIRLTIAERRVADRKERAGVRVALRAKTKELETLFRNVREVFFSVDLTTGELIQVSQQAETLLGVSAERLLGEPDLWRQYLKAGRPWNEVAALAPDSTLSHEYQVPSDARPRWVKVSLAVERDAGTGSLRADGVMVDSTTERLARMEAARRNEELEALHRLSELTLSASSLGEAYEEIIGHVSSVLHVDIAAIEELDEAKDQLVVVAARGIELPDDGFISVPLHQTLSGTAVQEQHPVLELDPKSRKEHRAEHLKRLKLAWYAAFPLMAGGRVRGTLMAAGKEPRSFDERFRRMGVTMATAVAGYIERLEAADALRENEARFRTLAGQLQQANQELESFAYSVSHDLRAPLRTMQGFAHALLQNFGSALEPEARDYANRIIASGRQSEELISDLLEYSRMSFERVELKAVELKAVVKAALEQLQGDLQEADAHVEVAGKLPVVMGNHTILVQVLTNLVSNAVKFVPRDRKPEIRIRYEALDGRARLTVEDNGIGVPEGQEERIFRVFERLTEGSSHPGTGIGLAIVRRGMQRIGGACGVERLPAGGSGFWIEAPLDRRVRKRPWASRGR